MLGCKSTADDVDIEQSSQQSKELLSLRWNNHLLAFRSLLSSVKIESVFSDVSVACSGKLYAVHKLVLSSCSDYFADILRATNCPQPVIVLKDISCQDFDALLSYMYLGEVNIMRSDLSSLLQASESLGIKGLFVPDDNDKCNSDDLTATNDPLHAGDDADESQQNDVCETLDDEIEINPVDVLITKEQITDGKFTEETDKGWSCSVSEDTLLDGHFLNVLQGQKRKASADGESLQGPAVEQLDSNCKKTKVNLEENFSKDSNASLEDCPLNANIAEFYEDSAFGPMGQVCVNIKEEPDASERSQLLPHPYNSSSDSAGQRYPHLDGQELSEEAVDEASCPQKEGTTLADIIGEALTGDGDMHAVHYLETIHCEDLSGPDSKGKGDDSEVCLLQLEPRQPNKQQQIVNRQSLADASSSTFIASEMKPGKNKSTSTACKTASYYVPIASKGSIDCNTVGGSTQPTSLCVVSGHVLTTSSNNNNHHSNNNSSSSDHTSGNSQPNSINAHYISSSSNSVLSISSNHVSNNSNSNSHISQHSSHTSTSGVTSNVLLVPMSTVSYPQHPAIVCPYCGKEFAFASDLRRHTRSHTGEKPYQCSLCPFKTSQRYNLERHKKIHEPKTDPSI
uniref:Protein tramtrack, alpha isoform-like n=2 Tax=Hirondellea gigas TaxID=1518452 RepID=A0A6A7G489_9CRUS